MNLDITEVKAYEYNGKIYKTRELALKAKNKGASKVIFELTMPNVGSWNGQWSGKDNKYTIETKLTKDKMHLIGGSFYYNFGDGWGANITCRLKGTEKPTKKFCGYEWMVRSIMNRGSIILERNQNETK